MSRTGATESGLRTKSPDCWHSAMEGIFVVYAGITLFVRSMVEREVVEVGAEDLSGGAQDGWGAPDGWSLVSGWADEEVH